MLHKHLSTLPAFLAGDHTQLAEVLHPQNGDPDLGYSLAYAYLEAGTKSLPHTLAQDELYLILAGEGRIHILDENQNIQAGSIVLVPKGQEQWVENTGAERLSFYCLVSPPWSEEGEQIGADPSNI